MTLLDGYYRCFVEMGGDYHHQHHYYYPTMQSLH
jgi:hypothetical protein